MNAILVISAALLFNFLSINDSLARNGGSNRPYYGGGKHTQEHGGSYPGGSGSSHKGGKYVNPPSGDRYGIHK